MAEHAAEQLSFLRYPFQVEGLRDESNDDVTLIDYWRDNIQGPLEGKCTVEQYDDETGQKSPWYPYNTKVEHNENSEITITSITDNIAHIVPLPQIEQAQLKKTFHINFAMLASYILSRISMVFFQKGETKTIETVTADINDTLHNIAYGNNRSNKSFITDFTPITDIVVASPPFNNCFKHCSPIQDDWANPKIEEGDIRQNFEGWMTAYMFKNYMHTRTAQKVILAYILTQSVFTWAPAVWQAGEDAPSPNKVYELQDEHYKDVVRNLYSTCLHTVQNTILVEAKLNKREGASPAILPPPDLTGGSPQTSANVSGVTTQANRGTQATQANQATQGTQATWVQGE